MKPMKRTSIDPDLEVAVSAGFQDCAWGKTWWLPKSMLRKLKPCDTRTWDIAALLETHDPARVAAIVGQLRRLVTDQIWSPERAQNYYPGSAQERRLVTQLISRNRDLALVLSASTSGYIRQYAIAKIDRLHGPFSLALLLLRLNDHVPQVQLAATSALKSMLARPAESSGLTVHTIVGCLDILLATPRFTRLWGPQTAIVDSLLAMPGVQQALEDLLLNEKRDRACRFLKLGLRLDLVDRLLPRLALSARHAGVRRLALSACLDGGRDGSPWHAIDSLVHAALEDRSPEVVRVALQHVLENRKSVHYDQTVFERLLRHPSLPIAERACFGLRSLGVDIVMLLRRYVMGSRPSLSAVMLLSRCGEPADAQLVLDAANCFDASGQIRCLQAAAALGSLDAAADLKRVALIAPSDLEARLASKALAAARLSVSFAEIAHSVEQGRNFVDRGLLRFAQALPTIQFAHIIVLAVSRRLACNYQALWEKLEKERQRKPFFPSQAEVETLRRLVADQPVLAESMRRVLGV